MTRRIRTLRVTHKQQLTPNMLRIILRGEDLADFPEGQESGYVKLRFPKSGLLSKPITRSYTIRHFSAKDLSLTLDFVAHGDNGPASAWAMNTQVGDSIDIDGPGPTKLMDTAADWFFIAGDMTALPAISVNLEQLPANAKGYAVIEIIQEEDKQDLTIPEGMEIHWVINPHPDQPNTYLVDAVKTKAWLAGKINVWVACEFDSMRAIRAYFKKERQVDRHDIYASSYWKMGVTDEGNKAAKKLDTEAD